MREKIINEAFPSMPVEILGMNSSAFAGADFMVTENEEEARKLAEFKKDNIDKKILTKDNMTLFENSGGKKKN